VKKIIIEDRVEAGIRGGLVVQDRRRAGRMLDSIATPVIEVGDHSLCEPDGEMCGECSSLLDECLPEFDSAWTEGR
jgi:hypothetical protein